MVLAREVGAFNNTTAERFSIHLLVAAN
jgi:hypothetical protein